MTRARRIYLMRRLRGIVCDEVWHVVVGRQGAQKERLCTGRFPKRFDFTADPFLLEYQGEVYCFYETLDANKKGVLGCHRWDGNRWSFAGIVLEQTEHLSYPQVFYDGDDIFMIPESSAANGIFLYRAEAFPRQWEKMCCLVPGRYADATVLKHNGVYYLFAYAMDPLPHLELWMADSLLGPWRQHPHGRKITTSRRLSRPGGAIITDEHGGLWRIAQDCNGDYGKRLFKVPILELSTAHYKEGRAEVLFLPEYGKRGVHTWNMLGSQWFAYDVKFFRLKPLKSLFGALFSSMFDFAKKVLQR